MRDRKARRVLGLVLALALFLPLAGRDMVIESSAVTQAEIDALKGDASSLASQRKDIQAQLKELRSDRDDALARRDLLERQIYVVRQEINNIDEQILMYGQLIAEKTAELEQAEADERAQFELFCRRMRYMEEQEEELDGLIREINSREDQLEAMEREVNESAKKLDNEIKRLEREMAAQIAKVPSESGFLWPLAGSINTVNSLFGSREDPITHKPGNHSGIDIPAAKNTPIYASKSGVVVTSILGSGGYWSYGNYVLISHSDGTSTLYAHMEKRNVSKGQVVKQGDVIGYVGTTGRSTGNHLHFEVRVNGSRVDPLNYFKDKALYYRNGKTVPLWDWMK